MWEDSLLERCLYDACFAIATKISYGEFQLNQKIDVLGDIQKDFVYTIESYKIIHQLQR